MRRPTRLPTASKLQLAMACAGSSVLEIVDSVSEAGEAGTASHSQLQRALAGELHPDESSPWLDGVLEAIEAVPGLLEALRMAYAEAAFAYAPSSGEATFLGSDIGRQYPKEVDVICGAVDYVADLDNRLVVLDLKTGLSKLPPIARLEQLRFAALVVWQWKHRPVQTAVLHAPRDGGRPWIEWGPTYNQPEAAQVAVDFSRLQNRIEWARAEVADGRTPPLRTGKHCEYCPSRMRCPAQVELVRQWAGLEASSVFGAPLDDATAAKAFDVLEAVEARVREARRQLYALAASSPIALTDGRILGPHAVHGRPEVDAGATFTQLEADYGREPALSAMTLRTSVTAIRAVVQAQSPRGSKRAAGDEYLQKLKTQGFIKESSHIEVSPYEPLPEALTSKEKEQ